MLSHPRHSTPKRTRQQGLLLVWRWQSRQIFFGKSSLISKFTRSGPKRIASKIKREKTASPCPVPWFTPQCISWIARVKRIAARQYDGGLLFAKRLPEANR